MNQTQNKVICSNCGRQNSPNMKFCLGCGASLSGQVQNFDNLTTSSNLSNSGPKKPIFLLALSVGLFVIIGMIGAGVLLFTVKSKGLKGQKKEAQPKQQKIIKPKEKNLEQNKQWAKFKTEYQENLNSEESKSLTKIIKKFKFPEYGHKKGKNKVVFLFVLSSAPKKKKLSGIFEYMDEIQDKHPGEISFIFVPVPREGFEKDYRELELLFEVFTQKGKVAFVDAYKKMAQREGSELTNPKSLFKMAKYLKLDLEKFKTAHEKRTHLNKIKELDQLAFDLNVKKSKWNLVIGKKIYLGIPGNEIKYVVKKQLNLQ